MSRLESARPTPRPTRRAVLRAALTLPAGAMLAACVAPQASDPVPSTTSTEPAPAEAAPVSTISSDELAQVETPLAPTPACGDDVELTLQQGAGPFYTPDSPQRVSLLEGETATTRLLLSGFVLTTDCRPVNQALLDFWHCDADGNYDNQGYRFRGHQYTNEQGEYQLETILPGLYPGRTRHIHVKVQAPNQPVLTTQLYFPDEPANVRDGIFRPELIVGLADAAGDTATGNDQQAFFSFVVA